MQGVLDGEALAQELGVPGQLGLAAGGREPGELVGHALGGADGDRRLAHDQAFAVEERGEGFDGVVHVGDVCGILAAFLRSAHADEVHVAEGGDLVVRGGEAQPPGFEAAAKDGLEARLVDGELAGVQTSDLVGVDVEAQDVEPEISHARRMGDSEVSGPDHREAVWHEWLLSTEQACYRALATSYVPPALRRKPY
ncbi:hypothetical protein GCM10020001_060560 [Nonomuraea salmonea]